VAGRWAALLLGIVLERGGYLQVPCEQGCAYFTAVIAGTAGWTRTTDLLIHSQRLAGGWAGEYGGPDLAFAT